MHASPIVCSILTAFFASLVVLLRHWPNDKSLAFHSFLNHPFWSVLLVHFFCFIWNSVVSSATYRYLNAPRVTLDTRPRPAFNQNGIARPLPVSTPLSADITHRSPRLPFSTRDV